jgi:uncharacterized protein (DUF934 family)
MAQLIKHSSVQPDSWQLITKDFCSDPATLPDGKILVHVTNWLARQSDLLGRGQENLGVWLDSDDEPEQIAEFCRIFPVIAVNFPVFTDGRGYSTGRLLRDRFGFEGELRAIGDVLIDQMYYLKRCGFDAYALRDDKDPITAIAALTSFTETYQGAWDQKHPLFRRRTGFTGHASK